MHRQGEKLLQLNLQNRQELTRLREKLNVANAKLAVRDEKIRTLKLEVITLRHNKLKQSKSAASQTQKDDLRETVGPTLTARFRSLISESATFKTVKYLQEKSNDRTQELPKGSTSRVKRRYPSDSDCLTLNASSSGEILS